VLLDYGKQGDLSSECVLHRTSPGQLEAGLALDPDTKTQMKEWDTIRNSHHLADSGLLVYETCEDSLVHICDSSFGRT